MSHHFGPDRSFVCIGMRRRVDFFRRTFEGYDLQFGRIGCRRSSVA